MTTKHKQPDTSPAGIQPVGDEALINSLERELDAALEATFPASDPIAVPSVATLKARRSRTRRQHRA